MSRHWGALLGLLWVQVCWVRGLEVEQSPSALSLQEGAGAALKCNFSQAVRSVQWFRQNPGGSGLTRLISMASGTKQSGRLNCTLNTRERSSALHTAASQLEDAASYLCAVETQCCLLLRGLHATCSCAWAPAPPPGGPAQQPRQQAWTIWGSAGLQGGWQ
uniref:Ig-like domain-containing protein n=1 Tax=Ursus americanus TaxID=9643 RepID=A0A452QEG8_URSAM